MDADLLAGTFVDLADTMTADYDIIDFLHILTDRSVRLLPASAAGVLLAGPRGELRAVRSSVPPRAARAGYCRPSDALDV